jgi:hypothetical protein
MNPLLAKASHRSQLCVLRTASWLVDRTVREEWLQEWQSELWHVRACETTCGVTDWRAEKGLFRFCLGAFKDVLCLRRLAREESRTARVFSGSAAQCLLVLSAILAVSYGSSLVLPGVRQETDPNLYKGNPNLILIQSSLVQNDSVATIPLETYRTWKERRQRYFDAFAFYRIARVGLSTGKPKNKQLSVARASLNLFWLLGLPLQYSAVSGDQEGATPGMILSDGLWRREFGADPAVVGRVVSMGHAQVRVIGVAPAGVWRLPGTIDAWDLEPDSMNSGVGYVVAHLTAVGRAAMQSKRVEIVSVNAVDDTEEALCGVSLADRTKGPWSLYRFAIFLALLALPGISSVSLGESDFCSHRPSWTSRACRVGFLCAKIGLLLPIVYYLSIDLAYWNAMTYSSGSQYAQLILTFSTCLFGMRWVLLDQRQRCPVCLKRVTHPAQVGLAGRTFLAWNGTELMCTGGHTLLHVPALPTSWFGTQRWMYLDTSWKFLFAGSSGT